MYIIQDSKEIELTKNYILQAAKVAQYSKCLKSQRGVVIVKNNEIISTGYNRPTCEGKCCLRENIHTNGQVELCYGVHAEWMALLNADKEKRAGAWLYHVKVKKGEAKPSGEPSCTPCSRLILEAGIAYVVLWHKEGYAVYDANEFNKTSFKYFEEKEIKQSGLELFL